MTLFELREYLRRDILRDKSRPSLWSDALLNTYLNEAQELFARRTHCLSDATSVFTFIDTVAGQANYRLDKRIIFISEIAGADGRPLTPGTKVGVPRTVATGRPSRYTTDAGVTTLRLWPVPDAVYTLDLLVARRPKEKLVADDDVPEIPEDYHLELCSWAAYRCLRTNDAEGANMAASEPFRTDWEMRVRDAKRSVILQRTGANARVGVPSWTGKR